MSAPTDRHGPGGMGTGALLRVTPRANLAAAPEGTRFAQNGTMDADQGGVTATRPLAGEGEAMWETA